MQERCLLFEFQRRRYRAEAPSVGRNGFLGRLLGAMIPLYAPTSIHSAPSAAAAAAELAAALEREHPELVAGKSSRLSSEQDRERSDTPRRRPQRGVTTQPGGQLVFRAGPRAICAPVREIS